MSTAPKKSGLRLLPIVGVAAVLVAGGAAAYMALKGAPTGSDGVLASAELIPDSAWMATYIPTDAASWQKLKQFGTPEAHAAVQKQIDTIRNEIRTQTGVDVVTDMQPWMGSVTIAVLPAANAESPAESPNENSNLLYIVGIKNKLKATLFARQIEAKQQGKITKQQHQGITISEITAPDGKIYSSAVLGDYWLVALKTEIVQQAIDTWKGKPSFAEQPNAAKVLRTGGTVDNPLAQIYITQPDVLTQQTTENSKDAGGSIDSIAAGVGVNDRGLHLKATTQFDPAVSLPQIAASSGKVIDRFPTDTIAFFNTQGIGQAWSELVAQANKDANAQIVVDQTRSTLRQANLDADRVFGWMDGESAIGIIPSKAGVLATVGFGGAIVLETSDRATAEATLKQLTETAKKSLPLPLSVSQKQVKTIPVTELSIPQVVPGAIVSYGWLDKNALLIALGSPIADVMMPAPAASLKSSESFQMAVGGLPQQNLGYAYANVEQIMAIVNALPTGVSSMTADTSAILNSIQGIGMTATPPQNSTSTLEVSMPLKRQ
jgi:Protein of unknown function (DUF3352)